MISLISKLVGAGFLVALASPASAYFYYESGPIGFMSAVQVARKRSSSIKMLLKFIWMGKRILIIPTTFACIHLTLKQPGTRQMDIPGSGNNPQLLGKIGYAYQYYGEYKTNISFIVKGPRPDLDRTCAMSIYFKPHKQGILDAITKPFIHIWDKNEDICKVEHITGEFEIKPGREEWISNWTGRGPRVRWVPPEMKKEIIL